MHRFVERCAHLGDRFVYEVKRLEFPATTIVSVDKGLATDHVMVPDGYPGLRSLSWRWAEEWMRSA